MIGTLKPYPAYKPSGLVWLEDMPDHWRVRRGKALFRCIDIRSRTGEEELLTVSSERGIVPRKTANVTMFKAESYIGHKLCWPDDLVINSLWAWARGLGVSRYHGIISNAYSVYRLREGADVIPSFIHNIVRSIPFQWELQVRSKGIWISRLQLTDESFLDAPILTPPVDEQIAIVRYLDYMDRRIQRYIRAKQKLIALLNEQKQAIIHQAVTRGLDPTVKLKPSGVEWLGDIPAHWETRRLKYLCSMKSGDSITSYSIEQSGEYPVYGGNGVRGFTSDYTHDGNYVLVGRQGALCGNIHITKGKFWASEHAVVATLRMHNDTQWFAALLSEMKLKQYSLAAAQPGLAVERILNLWVPVPSIEEQGRIAEIIKSGTSNLENTIEKEKHGIEIIREYRTRLISDVVTGKVDVREIAARLPDEEDEPELLSDEEVSAEYDEDTDNMDDMGEEDMA